MKRKLKEIKKRHFSFNIYDDLKYSIELYIYFTSFRIIKFRRKRHRVQCHEDEVSHFFPIPRTSTTFWRVLMAFSRTGSTDCMIPSLLSISLIWGCIPRWLSSFWQLQRGVVHHRVS